MRSSHLRAFRCTLIVIACLAMSSCYYMQAARGQLEMMRKREDIDEVIRDEATPEALANRLQLVLEARAFSVSELKLPDNDSYTSYANLERDYVVYSVIAVPEFSVEPKTWCYPIVGCVGYRGYFSEDKARAEADDLKAEGFDVAFGGVSAYSTLGRFDDPVLNTMMHWDDLQLVSVIFHELAHQQLYIKDDTMFNESFATAVEEAGMERWLNHRGQPEDYDRWRQTRSVRNQFAELAIATRDDLEVIYSSLTDEGALRAAKAERMATFKQAVTTLFTDAGMPVPYWLEEDLNNARLASIALYNQRVPEFRQLLADCDQDFACFYARAAALGAAD